MCCSKLYRITCVEYKPVIWIIIACLLLIPIWAFFKIDTETLWCQLIESILYAFIPVLIASLFVIYFQRLNRRYKENAKLYSILESCNILIELCDSHIYCGNNAIKEKSENYPGFDKNLHNITQSHLCHLFNTSNYTYLNTLSANTKFKFSKQISSLNNSFKELQSDGNIYDENFSLVSMRRRCLSVEKSTRPFLSKLFEPKYDILQQWDSHIELYNSFCKVPASYLIEDILKIKIGLKALNKKIKIYIKNYYFS